MKKLLLGAKIGRSAYEIMSLKRTPIYSGILKVTYMSHMKDQTSFTVIIVKCKWIPSLSLEMEIKGIF